MKIVDITINQAYLHISRGFLKIDLPDGGEKKTPIDDIDCLIVSGNAVSYSHNLIQRLCRENIPLIISGKNFLPCGMLLNLKGNYKMVGRLKQQIEMSQPLQKRLWQKVIQEKIRNQAKNISYNDHDAKDLFKLSEKVRSGDPDNIEGIAARKYWQRLFGKKFRRVYEKPGINSMLNFGYAILRSTMGRYIVGTGLNPALGIHHHNVLNPWCLADDLIEPYRPFIDCKISKMTLEEDGKLSPQQKRELAELFEIKFDREDCSSPLNLCIKETVLSFWKSIQEKKNLLEYPKFEPERI